MKRYKLLYDEPWVAEVECPQPGYPHKDADGEKQYVNSHFDTEEEAWVHVCESANCALSVASHDYEDAKKHMEEKKTRAAEAALRQTHVIEAFEQYRRSKGT